MCYICVDIIKQQTTPKSLAWAVSEVSTTDPHLNAILNNIADSGVWDEFEYEVGKLYKSKKD